MYICLCLHPDVRGLIAASAARRLRERSNPAPLFHSSTCCSDRRVRSVFTRPLCFCRGVRHLLFVGAGLWFGHLGAARPPPALSPESRHAKRRREGREMEKKANMPLLLLTRCVMWHTIHVPFIGPVDSSSPCQHSPGMAQSRATSFGFLDMHGADLLWDASEPLFGGSSDTGADSATAESVCPPKAVVRSPQQSIEGDVRKIPANVIAGVSRTCKHNCLV